MSHRPYPNRDRVLHQVERGRVPEPPHCPVCTHPVDRHATEDGYPVCTRGQGLISCRDCAELWARLPAVAAFMEFGRALQHGTGRQLLTEHPRRTGKTAVTAALADQAVKAGGHVHIAGRDGVRCAGGDPACSLPSIARGDQVDITYGGQSTRYEVTDIPVRDPRGRQAGLNLILGKLSADAEVTGE